MLQEKVDAIHTENKFEYSPAYKFKTERVGEINNYACAAEITNQATLQPIKLQSIINNPSQLL